MTANRFTSGHDSIAVYGIEDGDEKVTCIDEVDGFPFLMEPQELAEFLTEHDYTFEEAA